MSPPNPSLLLLEIVELGELLRESPSPSDSPGSLRLLGRSGRCALKTNKNTSKNTLHDILHCIYRNVNKTQDGRVSNIHTVINITPPKIQDHEWRDSFDMLLDLVREHCMVCQRAHLNDENAVIQVMNKLNTLVAIEVLVESRGVWFHLLLCIRVILWGEAILRLKVWVIILLLFVGWVRQTGIGCRSKERLAAQSRDRVL